MSSKPLFLSFLNDGVPKFATVDIVGNLDEMQLIPVGLLTDRIGRILLRRVTMIVPAEVVES